MMPQVFGFPSAQPSTIRHRWARACADVARRDQRTSVSRSSSVNVTSAAGCPSRATPPVHKYSSNFRRRTLEARTASLASQPALIRA